MRKVYLLVPIMIISLFSCQSDNYIDEEIIIEIEDEESGIILEDELVEVLKFENGITYITLHGPAELIEIQSVFPDFGIQEICSVRITYLIDELEESILYSDVSELENLTLFLDQSNEANIHGFIENELNQKFYLINQEFQYSLNEKSSGVGQISGTVWFDTNKDDLMDLVENGINGLELRLFKIQCAEVIEFVADLNTTVNPNTSSDDGYYVFNDLESGGKYFVELVLPAFGLVPCLNDVGTDDTLDSDFIDLKSPVVLIEVNDEITFDIGLKED